MLIFETSIVTFGQSWFKATLGITFSKLLFIDCVSGSKLLFINTSLVRALCCESGSKLVFINASLVRELCCESDNSARTARQVVAIFTIQMPSICVSQFRCGPWASLCRWDRDFGIDGSFERACVGILTLAAQKNSCSSSMNVERVIQFQKRRGTWQQALHPVR